MSNNYAFPGSFGVQVYGDAHHAWMPTRSIWNQHTYHITNVNDDGTIPAVEAPSWSTHNTYRLNAFLERDILAQADLTAGALEIIDHGTAQPLSLRVRLGNGGSLTLAQPVPVAFYQGNPAAGGVRLGTVTVPPLAGGSFQTVQLDGVTLTGSADVSAVVDPDHSLAECHEDNNVVALALASAAPLGGMAVVATDAAVYGPDSPVTLTATVRNPGSLAAAYTVQFRVTDHAGVPVATFAALPVTALAGGASVTRSQFWNTGATLAGDYLLVGTLTASNGTVLAASTAAFTISPSSVTLASLRTTTDRAIVHTSDTVTLAMLARNLTRNTLLAGTVVDVQVVAPSGQAVFATTLAVGDLAPGAQREVATTYRFQASPEGIYTVTAALHGAAQPLLTSSQTTLTVTEDVRRALAGTVAVQTPALERGAPQVCTETVTNHGTLAAHAQPLRHLVVGIERQQAVTSADTTMTLTPGASQTVPYTVDTGGFAAGTYACVLQAAMAGAWQTLGSAVFTVQTPPVQIGATFAVGDRGRVLVLLDRSRSSHHDDHDDDDHGDHDDDDHDDHGDHHDHDDDHDDDRQHHGDDDEGHDAHGPTGMPTLAAQQAWLEALLTQAGWSLTITTDADRFTQAFRSGGYVGYLLLAAQVKLPEHVQDELREAVYRGEGLIVAGDHDQRNGRLDDLMGIMSRGQAPRATHLVLTTSALHPAGEAMLAVTDTVAQFRLNGATAAGYVALSGRGHNQTPAVAGRDYGSGRTVYAGLNLLAEATLAGVESLYASLLLHALDYVHPATLTPRSGAVVPVSLTLMNQAIATPGQATLVLPPEVTVEEVRASSGAVLPQADGTVLWHVTLAEEATEVLTLWLRLPPDAGLLGLDAVLQIGQGSALSAYDTLHLALEVTQPPGLATALARVAALAARDRAYRQAHEALRQAEQALARHDAMKALRELLKAAAELRRFSTPPAAALRLAVAEALRQVAQRLAEQ